MAQARVDRRGCRGSLGQLSASVTTTTVREATFDVFRRRGLTTLFSNPGSTEVPFLTDLPRDIEFVLGLHEGPVVAMATGYALGRGTASLALLHTTAGLGNAVGAIATARVNRAPVVIVVGQQDRRHLVFEPFLTVYNVFLHAAHRGAQRRQFLIALFEDRPDVALCPCPLNRL